MKNMIDIFSSPTRVKVLRVLSCQSTVPLRHIAYLIEAPVFSVQYTLKKMMQENLVKMTKNKNRTQYFLNPKHDAYALIVQVFSAETQMVLQARSRHSHRAAKATLEFCNSSRKIFQTAKIVKNF